MVNLEKEVIMAYALDNAISHNGKSSNGSVLNGLFNEGLKKDEIKEIAPLINEIVQEVNSFSLSEQEELFEKLKSNVSKRKTREEGELPELLNAIEGNVVMRIAPFPTGPLHIGNTRAAILNDEFVKKYKGKFIFFFDDTIGSELKQIEPIAYDLILDGIKWLGIKPHKIFYKSDRNYIYYEYADELLKKGYMYVCSCSQESFSKLKEQGIECPCRHLPIETNLQRWKKMFDKDTSEGSLVVRLKTSMQDPDPAFRDRVMFKISEREHPRTKKKFRVYPSMEFSWGIDDYLIGTTHILRGIEHQMSTRVQDFIRGIFGWKNPVSIYNGLLQIEGVKISKSKGAKEVKSGSYVGWNDPRLWSLQSLKDRGISPETIREFIIKMGLNKSNAIVPIEVLYSINRKKLEKSPRYFFIEEPRKIRISGCPETTVSIPFHPHNDLGKRTFKTNQEFYISKKDLESMGEGNYRLMHLLNFKLSVLNPTIPNTFSFLSFEVEKNLKPRVISWLDTHSKNINVRVLLTDGTSIEGIGESSISKIKKGQIIYFENLGYVKLYSKSNNMLEFWLAHD